MNGNVLSYVPSVSFLRLGVLIVLMLSASVRASFAALPSFTLGVGFQSDPIHAQSLDKFVSIAARANIATVQPIAWREIGSTPSALIEATRKGALDMAIVPFAAVAAIEPTFEVFTTPFLFTDWSHLERVQLASLGSEILGNLGTRQLVGAGWWPGPFLAVAGDKPVLTPDDLRHSVLVYQAHANASAAKEIARGVGIRTRSADFQTTGVLGRREILEATPAQISGMTVKQRFVTLTNHLNDSYVIIANPAAWRRLSHQQQDDFSRIMEESWLHTAHRFQERQDALLKDVERGTVTSALGRKDLTLWQKLMTTPEQEAAMNGIRGKARDYPIFVLVSGEIPPARISWNTWLEDSQGNDIKHLKVGSVARINLDLARLPYRRLWSASAGKRVARALDAGESVKVLVQLILLGNLLMPAPGQGMKPFTMNISLKNATPSENDVSTLEALSAGKIATKDVSARLALGNIAHWPVLAKGAGCADIAFAVWDEARLTPLDHIVVSVSVAKSNGEAEKCYGKYDSQEMRAGLDTLLAGPQGVAAPVDLALHVFEFDEASFPRSVGVLVDARRLREAETARQLSSYGRWVKRKLLVSKSRRATSVASKCNCLGNATAASGSFRADESLTQWQVDLRAKSCCLNHVASTDSHLGRNQASLIVPI